MAFQLKTGSVMTDEPKRKKFVPNIYWSDGDAKTVVFVTEIDDIPECFLHEFVKVPDNSDKGWHYEMFLCRRDPSMVEDTHGVCPLCEKGYKAKKRWIAQAIELEQKLSGRKVTGLTVKYETYTNREQQEVSAPKWGLVIQGKKNFFRPLGALALKNDSVKDSAYEVLRQGNDQHTAYSFDRLAVAVPDLTDALEEVQSLVEMIEELGSDAKYSAVSDVEVAEEPAEGTDAVASNDGFDAIKAEVEKAVAEAQAKGAVEKY